MPTDKRIHPDDLLGVILGNRELQMYGLAKQLFSYAKEKRLLDGKFIEMDEALKAINKETPDNKQVHGNKPETFQVIKMFWGYIKKKNLFK